VLTPIPKPTKFRSKKYLLWVAEHDCLVCHAPPPAVIAHHVRYLGLSGIGTKVSDKYAVPLCVDCHNALHDYQCGERDWWAVDITDPLDDHLEFINSEEARDERRRLEQEDA